MSTYTWTKVSILRVRKLHTDKTLSNQRSGNSGITYKKTFSLHCEETRNLKAWMIMSHFALLMLQILSPPLPKMYFQVSAKILLSVLAREAHVHVLELVALTSGGQKPFLPGPQLVSHQHTCKSS